MLRADTASPNALSNTRAPAVWPRTLVKAPAPLDVTWSRGGRAPGRLQRQQGTHGGPRPLPAPAASPARAGARRPAPCAATVAGSELLAEQFVFDSFDEEVFEPSNDLRELAAAQLRSTFEVLRRVGGPEQQQEHGCRACVFARTADSLESPHIRLQRVACWPKRHLPPHGADGGWTPAAPSVAGVGGDAQQQRRGEQPYGGGFEEMDETLTLHRPAWEAGGAGGAAGGCDTEASLCQEEVVLLPNSNLLVLPLAEAGVLVGLLVVEVAGGGGGGGGGGTAAGALGDDVLWCLRTAVPPLAKACAMDLRAALAGAQHEAQRRLARSLLVEARKPLKVLSTFGQMLAPRLQRGSGGASGDQPRQDWLQPEQDMAAGMLMQGQALADVIAQLEAALRPSAALQGGAAPQRLALPPAAAAERLAPPLLARGGPQQQLRGLPPAGAGRASAGLLPECSSSSSSSSGSAASSDTRAASNADSRSPQSAQQQQPPQQQLVLPHLPGEGTGGSLRVSSRDIRWGGEQTRYAVRPSGGAPSAAAPCQPAGARGGGGDGATEAPCLASYRAAAAGAGQDFDLQRTIDMEPAAPDEQPAAAAALAQQQQQRAGCCNLIDALSHLLSAAARLASAQGIDLIVNAPLLLDPPLASAPGSPSAGPGADVGAGGAPALLPRPVRPLLVGLAAGTCRRVLGYILDVALQSTPRGGQMCVTARSSAGGVELNVLHTGQVQPGRLHTTTRTFAAAAAGLGPRGGRRAGGAAAREAAAAGGGSAQRPGSSLVSLDFAGQALQSLGGRLSVMYPTSFMNATSGQLEVGSQIDVWLPPPGGAAAC